MKSITIRDTKENIPVGKILCIGRNYAEHAKEMKADVLETPVVFIKPSTAIIFDGEEIVIPKISDDMHHEVELVVAIGKSGKNIPASEAHSHILGYAIGLDMTLRDVQSDAKKKGLPWTAAKGFDTSAPVSEIIPAKLISDPHNLTLICRVNGEVRQQSSTDKMISRIEKLIEYISTIFTLERGDLIFTGTPEGVSRVVNGDIIEAELVGFAKIIHQVKSAY
ncbi:MAG: fumarylacetoacetate hydrolase family protein [Bacteroidetes bacterium]|nr:fumarylacetoacetate hydrolase family protein [Bacteroidota bacterium]MBU1423891.1 fumarylacetoacetate hydrolase family protein [Bacteroidota bacterium]MBU2471112.1 fumarylacetoacetate hydrolase family protein [Bacteroidota bacterium]MBU2636800.1 fumarylacetoacetate hydrolase family protein [Bacteroidota bacterium]